MSVSFKIIRYGLFLLLCTASGLLMASAENDFNEATKLFKSADYTGAVKKFESAYQQGMKSTALYYNLGSTYFKLENYTQASRFFNELRKQADMKSLAEYNLGLIAVKQNKISAAVGYFESVEKTNDDSKLVYLSKKQLFKLNTTHKPWSVYTSFRLGYDDNINFAPVDTVLDQSGSFLDFMLSADYLVNGSRRDGWVTDAIFYRTNYFSTNIYDQDLLAVGLKKLQQISDWDTYLKASFEKYTYAQEDYLSVLKFDAWGKTNLSNSDRLYLRYRYEDISSDRAVYDYLEGWRQKLRAEYRQYNKSNISQLYYELELNDRNDLLFTTGEEFSYSPTRHTVRATHTRIIDSQWRYTGDLAYRNSDYPATATQDREDDRWMLSIYADYRFDKTMKLRPKIEYTDNSSTEVFYDYNRTVYSIEFNKLF